MKRLSSQQSSHRSSTSSSGFIGHENLAYIEEDDELAANEDSTDRTGEIKKGILEDLKEEDMTDSMRRQRKLGTGNDPKSSLQRPSVGLNTFVAEDSAQANGTLPSDTAPDAVEELRQMRAENTTEEAEDKKYTKL